MRSFERWLTTEAKEERVDVYHGTSSARLHQIMVQGLIPFPKKKVWQTDPGSFHRPSRASIGGIYVTTNLMTATSSAFNAVRGTKNNQLIVCMNIHPYSMVADEDDFTNLANVPIPDLVTTEYGIAGIYIPMILIKRKIPLEDYTYNISKEHIEKVKNHFIEEAIWHFKKIKLKDIVMHPELEKRLRELLDKEGFEAAVIRQAAYIEKYSFTRVCDDYGHWEDGCPVTIPNKEEAERNWTVFLDKISKTLKSFAHFKSRKSDYNKTARVLKAIGFSGRDRITCIFEIKQEKREDRSIYVSLIHYGTPPADLIEQWHKAKGEWIPIHKKTA